MLVSKIVLFASILFAAANIPGPNIVFLVAHVLSKGNKGIAYYIFAMLLGEALWLSVAYLGLSAALGHADYVITIIKWLGAAYLIYIAYNLWKADTRIKGSKQEMTSKNMFASGIFLSIGNPKIMMFYVSVLPFVVRGADREFTLLLILVATMTVVVGFVYAIWLIFATKLRNLLGSPRFIGLLNKWCALLMIVCAIFIALSK